MVQLFLSSQLPKGPSVLLEIGEKHHIIWNGLVCVQSLSAPSPMPCPWKAMNGFLQLAVATEACQILHFQVYLRLRQLGS